LNFQLGKKVVVRNTERSAFSMDSRKAFARPKKACFEKNEMKEQVRGVLGETSILLGRLDTEGFIQLQVKRQTPLYRAQKKWKHGKLRKVAGIFHE